MKAAVVYTNGSGV